MPTKLCGFEYNHIGHIFWKISTLCHAHNLFYASLLETTYQIMLNPYQVFANAKCHNFCLKHCFYFNFGMLTLFINKNRMKSISPRFSRFLIFRVFRNWKIREIGKKFKNAEVMFKVHPLSAFWRKQNEKISFLTQVIEFLRWSGFWL